MNRQTIVENKNLSQVRQTNSTIGVKRINPLLPANFERINQPNGVVPVTLDDNPLENLQFFKQLKQYSSKSTSQLTIEEKKTQFNKGNGEFSPFLRDQNLIEGEQDTGTFQNYKCIEEQKQKHHLNVCKNVKDKNLHPMDIENQFMDSQNEDFPMENINDNQRRDDIRDNDQIISSSNQNGIKLVSQNQQATDKSAKEQFSKVKSELQQYFGNQKELDDRENEVLKRISDIKKRMQCQSTQNIQEPQENQYPQQYQLLEKQINVVEQHTNKSNNDCQFGAKKFRDDFENVVNQLGSNEDKNRIEGLKNMQKQEIKNIEMKNKIKVQELENTISHLRQHMNELEERNKVNIMSVQAELLKQQKLVVQLDKESRTGIHEVRLQFQQENNSLKLKLETEKAKCLQIQRKFEDLQVQYNQKNREFIDFSKKSKQNSVHQISFQSFLQQEREYKTQFYIGE